MAEARTKRLYVLLVNAVGFKGALNIMKAVHPDKVFVKAPASTDMAGKRWLQNLKTAKSEHPSFVSSSSNKLTPRIRVFAFRRPWRERGEKKRTQGYQVEILVILQCNVNI